MQLIRLQEERLGMVDGHCECFPLPHSPSPFGRGKAVNGRVYIGANAFRPIIFRKFTLGMCPTLMRGVTHDGSFFFLDFCTPY